MLLKIWPHLTFGWPVVNISLTIHPTHSKLYIFVIHNLTSDLIYMKGHLKHFENLTPTWPLRDPYWKGAKSSKIYKKFKIIHTRTQERRFGVLKDLKTQELLGALPPEPHQGPLSESLDRHPVDLVTRINKSCCSVIWWMKVLLKEWIKDHYA